MAATSEYVEIHPGRIATAAAGIDDAGGELSAALLDLIRALNRSGAPWGDDDLGRAFFDGAPGSIGFRQARDELLDGTAQLALALRGHAVRAVRMARTWAGAESGDHPRFRLNTTGGSPALDALRRVAGPETDTLVRKDPPPPWYEEIEPLLEEMVAGCRRPAGDAAGMASVARTFDRMADAVDEVTGTAGDHARRISADNAGREIEAFGESFARLSRNGGGFLEDAAAAYRGLAGYCRYMGTEIAAAESQFATSISYLAALWAVVRLVAATPQGPVYLVTAVAETRTVGVRLLAVLRGAEARAAAAGVSYVGGLDLVRQLTRIDYGLQDRLDWAALGKAAGLGAFAGGATGVIYRLLSRAAVNGGTLSALLTGTVPGRLVTHAGVGGAVNIATDVAGNAIEHDGTVHWDEIAWGKDLLMGVGMGIHAEAVHALRSGERVIPAELGVHDHDLPAAGPETDLAGADRAARPEDPLPKVVDGTVLNVRDTVSSPAGKDGPEHLTISPPPRPDAGRAGPAPRRETGAGPRTPYDAIEAPREDAAEKSPDTGAGTRIAAEPAEPRERTLTGRPAAEVRPGTGPALAEHAGSRIAALLNGHPHAPGDGAPPDVPRHGAEVATAHPAAPDGVRVAPELTIRPDCEDWVGYKPCGVQRELGLADCGGCAHHRPAPAVLDLSHQRPYDPAELAHARRVGVVEMGGLGSHVRTSAVVKALREVNPRAEVLWFTHRRGAEVVGHIPGVRPVDIETGGVPHDVVRGLDVVLNFETGDAAREIVRTARSVGGLTLNAQDRFQPASEHAYHLQRLQIHDAWRRNNTATMQRILLETVGLDHATPRYDLVLADEAVGAARARLDGLFGEHDRDLVALNIGSSLKGRLKRWTPQAWADLAAGLAADDAAVVVLAGPEDHDIRDQVASLLAGNPSPWIRLVDDMDVGEFMAILGAADVVVTADSLALHAAAAQSRPLVALAGPMPHRELELAETDRMVGPRLGCSPCYLRCHRRIQGECMTLIGVAEVLAHVRDLRP
ncbi:glycosyltransferase family 9 protein [Actinoallomurus iriomotensis]|uniref:glycosyltransferase family 9 protein n=1 Tax=Actinoallomurus iriomotensis TaxID=478107 RepID=UPI002552E2B6|nr:glycosyltransferase family 9 protein [Actinoallomurus iriomotensis]